MERLVETALYVLVAPWQCLKISLDNVTNGELREEERIPRFKAWIQSKRNEAGNVSVSVSVSMCRYHHRAMNDSV